MAAAYYAWDLLASIYVMYGYAFIIHAVLSLPGMRARECGPRRDVSHASRSSLY